MDEEARRKLAAKRSIEHEFVVRSAAINWLWVVWRAILHLAAPATMRLTRLE
jgi:hypothetical protein